MNSVKKTEISDNIQTCKLPQPQSVNVWDKDVPIEKSSYVLEATPEFNIPETIPVPAGSLTMIDLFCGAGGFSVGCSWADFYPVLGLDYLKPAIDTWKLNHPHALSCLGDIRQVEPMQIKQMLAERGVEKINLLTAGVPCQGFSSANRKHNDDDSRNFLFIEYMRFVKVFDPDYIIIENVSGLRSTAGGKFEGAIKHHMEQLGYTVTVGMVNAAEYGVPQVRHRLIFIGVKAGRSLTVPYAIPVGEFTSPDTYRTVGDAISDLPGLGNDEQKYEYETVQCTEYQVLMRGDGDIPIPTPLNLSNHASPKHSPDVIKRIANTRQSEPLYPKFKQRIRLKLDAPSPTQLAGGIRPQSQFWHPVQPRGLSIRECARIQSFPDSYEFLGGMTQERVLTGNAVPPLLAYALAKPIAEDIRSHLQDEA